MPKGEKDMNSTRERIIPIKIETYPPYVPPEYIRTSTPRPPSPASTMIEIESDLEETIRPSSRNSYPEREITHKVSYSHKPRSASTDRKDTKNVSQISQLSENDKKKIAKEEEKRLKKIKDDEKKLRKEQEKRQKDAEKEVEKRRKEAEKMNVSKKSAKIDINDNPIDSSKVKRRDGSRKNKNSPPPVTVQPGKSILKNPLASSTPIPPPDTDSEDDHNYTNLKPSGHANDATWNRSSTSNATVVHKKPSACSKCKSWCCLPFGLCCICNPFECECCDCCYLKCVRCDQCLCRCCNQKCC